MPTVSIIIPLYKSEAYIRKTLDSVLAQTHTEFEVLCVDDCSPDHTPTLIQEYAERDNRIKLIRHQKNMGAPAFGRNTGLTHATGDYVTFLDHDDSFLPTKLEVLLEVMSRGKVDFVCSNCFLVNSKTGKTDMTAWGSIKGDPKSGFAKRLLWDNFVPPNSTLIRRSVFETVQGFDTNLKGVDDFDLWYRIARDFKATICEIPLATWRYNNESSISFDQSLMIEDESRFYKKILALPDVTNLEKEVCKERISMNQVRLANQKLAVGQYQEASRLYGEAGNTRMQSLIARAPQATRAAYHIKRKLNKQFKPLQLEF